MIDIIPLINIILFCEGFYAFFIALGLYLEGTSRTYTIWAGEISLGFGFVLITLLKPWSAATEKGLSFHIIANKHYYRL